VAEESIVIELSLAIGFSIGFIAGASIVAAVLGVDE